MASQGPLYPSTATDNSSIGTVSWGDETLALVDDGDNASVGFTGSSEKVSHYLVLTNFGFTIPVGATIDGILVEVKNQSVDVFGGEYIKDSSIKIVQGGAIKTTNLGNNSAIPTSFSYVSYGSSSNLWGESWAYSDVNASNFGVAISFTGNADAATAWIDAARITVTYTEATTTSTSSSTSTTSSSTSTTSTSTSISTTSISTSSTSTSSTSTTTTSSSTTTTSSSSTSTTLREYSLDDMGINIKEEYYPEIQASYI